MDAMTPEQWIACSNEPEYVADICGNDPVHTHEFVQEGARIIDALRSQLAALSAGKAWIPEPTEREADDLSDGYAKKEMDERECFLAGVEWARENAEAVAPVVRIYYPGICDDDIDEMWEKCKDAPDPARAMASEGYTLATEHQLAGTEITVGAPVVVLPELTDAMLDLACGCELPVATGLGAIPFGLRAARREAYRNAWNDARSRIRTIGPEADDRPAWSILSGKTHELRPYGWDEGDEWVHGFGLYSIGAPAGGVPLQRYRARTAGPDQVVVGREELEALRDVATGRLRHLYDGQCPDTVEGLDVRDPNCPACQAIERALRRAAPEGGA